MEPIMVPEAPLVILNDEGNAGTCTATTLVVTKCPLNIWLKTKLSDERWYLEVAKSALVCQRLMECGPVRVVKCRRLVTEREVVMVTKENCKISLDKISEAWVNARLPSVRHILESVETLPCPKINLDKQVLRDLQNIDKDITVQRLVKVSDDDHGHLITRRFGSNPKFIFSEFDPKSIRVVLTSLLVKYGNYGRHRVKVIMGPIETWLDVDFDEGFLGVSSFSDTGLKDVRGFVVRVRKDGLLVL